MYYVSGNRSVFDETPLTPVNQASITMESTLKKKVTETAPEEHFELSEVQAAHQFVRKFPDSTKGIIEIGPDGMAVSVLLLIQQPNAKTVQVKKDIKFPPSGFQSKEESVS